MGFFQRAGAALANVFRAKGPTSSQVIPILPLTQQWSRIGGSITPGQVSSIIAEADTGYPYRLMDLANEARQKDGHLQSVLHTRETAITTLKWTVRAPEKARKRDKKVALFVERALRQSGGNVEVASDLCGFSDMLAHLAGAAYYGWGVAETVMVRDGKYLVPSGWKRIAPRRFIFTQETGRLHHFDQTGGNRPYPGIDLLKEYPGRFIVHQPRITGDIQAREGLCRVLMWPALFRNWDVRDWLQLAELAWKPWRTGQYKANAQQRTIDDLVDILDRMASTGVAVYPETADVKVEWPRNGFSGTSAHGELAAFLAAEMSKAVLGQTLTTEQGRVGSQALGRVHDEVRKDIVEADATSIAATIRRHLIAPLVRMNFGADVMVPEFEFVTQDAVDLVPFATSMKLLSEAGTKIPQAWVRDVAGIPDPVEGDELLGGIPLDSEADPENAGDSAPDATVEVPTEPGDAPAAEAPEDKPAKALRIVRCAPVVVSNLSARPRRHHGELPLCG